MATFKQLTDQYIADLKTNASGDEQLFDWYSRGANRLALRAQKLQQNADLDAQSFLRDPSQKAAFDTHRAAKKAERAANGESEE